MNRTRFLLIPFVMIFLMSCGLVNGIQQAATQFPALLTSAPTTIGAFKTQAAGQSSGNCPSTPTSGGLGIDLNTIKVTLMSANQFVVTDGSVGGQAASTATLGPGLSPSFPAIANGISVKFIGDPCNISQVVAYIPRTDSQDTVDQGIGLIDIVIAGFLPANVQLGALSWLAQVYATVRVGDQQQNTIAGLLFTLSRDQAQMILQIDPEK